MSFPKYPVYKDSGVEWLGNVPQHWQLRRLGHHFHERRTRASDAEYMALSVTKAGIVPQLETAAKTQDGDNRKLVLNGDFVINSRSDRKGSSGLVEQDGSVSLISIVLEPIGINGWFVHHLLRSVPFQEEFYRWGKGIVADLWSTNFSDMKNIILAVPPSAEQEVIADFLDYETSRIDALIAEQQRLIELLQEKRQAVITQAVTKGLDPSVPMKDSGVEWLGEVPESWTITPLKHLAALNPSKANAKLDPAGTCSFVAMESLKLDSLELGEIRTISEVFDGYSYFEDGDLLQAKVTPCFENMNLAIAEGLESGIGFGSTEINVLRATSAVNNRFLFYRLQEDGFMHYGASAMTGAGGLKRVPSETLMNYSFGLPPLDEQIAIAEHLDRWNAKFGNLTALAATTISTLSERRSALISAAVTGKIDVRDWQPPSTVEDAASEELVAYV